MARLYLALGNMAEFYLACAELYLGYGGLYLACGVLHLVMDSMA